MPHSPRLPYALTFFWLYSCHNTYCHSINHSSVPTCVPNLGAPFPTGKRPLGPGVARDADAAAKNSRGHTIFVALFALMWDNRVVETTLRKTRPKGKPVKAPALEANTLQRVPQREGNRDVPGTANWQLGTLYILCEHGMIRSVPERNGTRHQATRRKPLARSWRVGIHHTS